MYPTIYIITYHALLLILKLLLRREELVVFNLSFLIANDVALWQSITGQFQFLLTYPIYIKFPIFLLTTPPFSENLQHQ